MTLRGEYRSTRSKPRISASLSTKKFKRTDPWGSAMRGRRLTASAMDKAYHILLIFFLQPLFLFTSSFLLLSFILYSVLNGSSTVPTYPTKIQGYFPNGHSRHSSDSFSFSYRPVYEPLACCRNETDTESDSSHVSAEVSKRSEDGDSPNGNEDTEDNTDDTTTDNDQEQDDDYIDDNADEETDTR